MAHFSLGGFEDGSTLSLTQMFKYAYVKNYMVQIKLNRFTVAREVR